MLLAVGRKSDFIMNNKLLKGKDKFEIDSYLPRATRDHGSNRFGDRLPDLCNGLNLRF
jgi:hypothetical protein